MYGSEEKHGSFKKHDPSKYYRPYCHLAEDSIGAAIAEQAREELDFARGELTKYRKHVNRAEVTGKDTVEYMGGHQWLNTGLWALYGVCDSFHSKVKPMGRLAKVLERHAERLHRQIEALYEQDKAQVRAAKDAEHEVWLASLTA